MKILLGILLLLSMLVSITMVFLVAPIEETMGVVQKIFYFHVATAWVGFLAFFVVFIGSIGYLAKKSRRWDRIAYSSAGIGVLFTTLCLITGSLWAKPAWGIWWTWDARLTSTLVLWFMYVAYLIVRYETEGSERGAVFSAVLGVIGFVDIPIVFMSVRWWRTVHCDLVIVERTGLTPIMLFTLLLSVFTFTLLYFYLLITKYEIAKTKDEITSLKEKLRE
ncbi:MAG: cytochrome C assembly protein [Candidatus Cloacimonadota bacterium]|nr:MAG: cytochrome C assembly protein [Candidatus Cloacimonadota bacterium]